MRDAYILIVASVMFLSIFFISSPIDICSASVITVNDGGGANYITIQDAIDNANIGDTIQVYGGPYSENILIDKSITLTGSSVTINGNDDSEYTIKIDASNVIISGFTVQNNAGKDNDFGCILLYYSSNCELNNNIFKNGKTGIYLVGSTGCKVEGNTVENNLANGITLTSNSNNNEITDNVIQNNGDKGIQFTSSSSNTVSENTITGHMFHGVRLTSNSNSNVFYQNHFSENELNAEDDGSNTWHYNSEGNYWDDYNNYDDNDDGIGDEPYITGGVNDLYPLGEFLSNQKPVATIDSITPNPAIDGHTIYFYGHGTDDGTIIDWEWQANSYVLSTGQEDIQYSSLSAGTYTVRYRVTDDKGQQSSWDVETLVVNSQDSSQQNQRPTGIIDTISPTTAYEGDSVFFKGTGDDSDGTIATYYWSSNLEGPIGSSPSFSKSDLSVGEHTITFIVTDNDGAQSIGVTDTLTILPIGSDPTNQDPIANADAGEPYNAYIDQEISFDGSDSTDPDGTIVDYTWDFGDETTGKGEHVSHTYSIADAYTVTLTVEDNEGSVDTDTTTATIYSLNNEDPGDTTEDNGKWVIPGFEAILIFSSLVIIVIFTRFKTRKK